MSTTHTLKTLSAYWYAVERGDKNFEVRRNDRGFQTGDTLLLEHFDPNSPPHPFQGSHPLLARRITYILPGGEFGIDPGYVVMGIEKTEMP